MYLYSTKKSKSHKVGDKSVGNKCCC